MTKILSVEYNLNLQPWCGIFSSTDVKFFYHIGRNPKITASSAILVLITILPEIWFEQTAVLIEAVGITFSRDAGLL